MCVAEALVASESSVLSLGKARHTDCSRAVLMALKAASIGGDQSNSSAPFLLPLGTVVSGRRVLAAAGINRW